MRICHLDQRAAEKLAAGKSGSEQKTSLARIRISRPSFVALTLAAPKIR
jgi:hypothetical protein